MLTATARGSGEAGDSAKGNFLLVKSEVLSTRQDMSDSHLLRQTQGLPEVIHLGGKKKVRI